MTPKPSQMEPLRLAKKLTKLWYRTGEASAAERKVLRALGDIWSMRDSECRKSLQTIQEDHDISPRMFQYAMEGRKRQDGSEYYPGLLKRGVVIIKRQETGRPVVYIPDLPLMRQLCGESSGPEDVSKDVSAPTHKPTHNGADDPRTNGGEPTHKWRGTYAQGAWGVRTGCVQGTPEVPEGAPKEGTKTKTENSSVFVGFASSPSATGSAGTPNPKPKNSGHENPNGQEKPSDAALENVLVRIKKIAPNARFAGQSREKLQSLLPSLNRGGFLWADFDFSVQKTLECCTDEKSFAFFGTTLVKNLVSDMRARKESREAAARRAKDAKPWCDRVDAYIKSAECDSLDDVEYWIETHPKDDGAAASLADFYVHQAIDHCQKPNLVAEYEALLQARKDSDENPGAPNAA
jgi:hypothetical protein